ncbi:MAG TPA: thioredoxin domain-containing protein, partial [Myxococcota bacterium]|nr:thioredoxin domain-containing protein [Myxococcota bacterium]
HDPAAEQLARRARALLRAEDAVLVIEPGQALVGVDRHWIEGRTLVGGRATAYVCRGVECSAPANSPDDLASLC